MATKKVKYIEPEDYIPESLRKEFGLGEYAETNTDCGGIKPSTPIFAEELKAARKASGLTQQAMADIMLIPKRTIEKWEHGTRVPPPYVQRFVLNELYSLKQQ